MENEIILSVLIPTIPERGVKLSSLTGELYSQIHRVNSCHPSLGKVEVLIDYDKKFINGGKSVGKKRDDLVQAAKGKYLCFLDDDDNISPGYIESLLRLAQHDCHVITFNSLFKCDHYWTVIDMSIRNTNEEATPENIVKRNAWHICPIKSEIAKQFRFPDKNNAEDWAWMEQVLTLVKSEVKSNMILHQYNHSHLTSAVDEIERINP